MSDTNGRGPYVSEDGTTVWIPADMWSWPAARREAAEYAYETGDPWTRTVFVRKETVPLHDHEEPWDIECGKGCTPRPAYRFDLYEGSWRR